MRIAQCGGEKEEVKEEGGGARAGGDSDGRKEGEGKAKEEVKEQRGRCTRSLR